MKDDNNVTNMEHHKLKKFYDNCTTTEIAGDIRRTMLMVMKLHRHLSYFEADYPELYHKTIDQLEREGK